MPIDHWYAIAGEIAFVLFPGPSRPQPDYDVCESSFMAKAIAASAAVDLSAAALWDDGAHLAREMAHDLAFAS